MSTAVLDNRSSSDVVDSEKPGTSVYTETKNADETIYVHVQNEGLGYQFTPQELPKRYYTSLYFMGTMLALRSAFAAGVGGFALAAPILGVINADIGPSPLLIWVGLAYTLPVAIGYLLVGRLSDIFGRRYFFIGGSALGLIGCIVCALATSIPMMIGGMTLIGLGAAPQTSVVYVVSELIPVKYRFLGNGFIYLWVIPLTGMGPSISYSLIVSSSWRSCFYLMIAINAFSLGCWALFYFPPTFKELQKDSSLTAFIKEFDYVGLFLFTSGLLVFLMGLSWGGSLYPWNSGAVISCIIIGFLTLAAFIAWEAYANPKQPLLPLHLFRNFQWVAMIFTLAISVTVYYAFSIVWPQQVFAMYTTDLIKGGLLCSLVGAGTNIGQLALAVLGRHLGNQRIQFIVCVGLGGAFLGAVACATPYNMNTAAALLTIGCFFTGYIDSVGLAMAGICIKDQKDIGTAVGIAGSVRSAVSTVGTAVYSVIITNRRASTISAYVPAALTEAGLPASSVAHWLAAYAAGTPAALAGVAGNTAAINAISAAVYKEAMAKAFQTVYLVTIAFSGACLILSFFCPNASKLLTSDVATKLHGKAEKPTAEKMQEV